MKSRAIPNWFIVCLLLLVDWQAPTLGWQWGLATILLLVVSYLAGYYAEGRWGAQAMMHADDHDQAWSTRPIQEDWEDDTLTVCPECRSTIEVAEMDQECAVCRLIQLHHQGRALMNLPYRPVSEWDTHYYRRQVWLNETARVRA